MNEVIQRVEADLVVGISDLKKNPSAVLAAADGASVAVLNHNKVVAYLLPADVYEAIMEELDDFRQEFDRIRDAYWYDADADTYVIRHADKAVWVVFQTNNDGGGLLVAEGPLPAAPAK